MKTSMNARKSAWSIALLSLAVTFPVFAQQQGAADFAEEQGATEMTAGGGNFNENNNGGNNNNNNNNNGGRGGRGNRNNGNNVNNSNNGNNVEMNAGGGVRNMRSTGNVQEMTTMGGGGRPGRTNNGGGGGGPGMSGGGGGGGGGGGFGGRRFSTLPAEGDYQILNSTSIFAKNRVALDNNPSETTAAQPQNTRNGPPPVFVGVMQENGGYVAFLEVTSRDYSSSVVPVKVGDTIQWDNGSVKSVSMDKLQIVANGQTLEIPLGHNLQNQPAQPAATYVPPVSADVGNRGNPVAGNFNNQGNFGNRGGNQFGFGGNNGGFGGNFGGNNGGFGGGGGGRGGRGGGGGGGGFGGGNNGGFGGNNGGFGGGGAAFTTPTAPVVTNDPPLPAGTTDDLEARLRARRAQQVGGGN